MKTALFTVVAAAMLSQVFAAPTEAAIAARGSASGAHVDISIPPSCKVCDSFGLGCIALCILTTPADPACELCAGGAIGICLEVCEKSLTILGK
jgi:hypothetical protein